jgi:ABC-type polysaccharide/polyol phosphate transport system ATPase subunit
MSVIRNAKATPGQPLIELHHVSKRFAMHRERHRSFQESFIRIFRKSHTAQDEFWPLRDVSITIYPGDCIGIIGRNGSGKSTLLKMISGILPPTSGDLTVSGRISALLELGAGFHPDLTGRENVYLNGSIYGISRQKMSQIIDKIIDYAELGDFIDTPIKHYSSGMYVRLGFAVAIHTEPDLMLVDEVLAVGDAAFQRKCMDSIQLYRRQGGTLLLVSHDLGAIQAICNRVLWIEDGVIQAEGHPTDVMMSYQRYYAELEEARQLAHQDPQDDSEQNTKQRWGTGQIRVTKVELCDAKGEAHINFRTGDPMTVRLHYEAKGIIEEPIFGLAIHHQQGTHICGPNTKFGGLALPLIEGPGVISYVIPSLALLAGGYLLSIAVINQNNTETFDYHDRTITFHVYPGDSQEQYGLVTLNGVWQREIDPIFTPPVTEKYYAR